MRSDGALSSEPDDSVRALLADVALREQMEVSAGLAERLLRRAAGRVELRPRPHQFAAFHVLRRAETPAVLIEAGYISNADDEAMLMTKEGRAPLVLALAQAVEADMATRAATLSGFPGAGEGARRSATMASHALKIPDLVTFNHRVHRWLDPWFERKWVKRLSWGAFAALMRWRDGVRRFRDQPAHVREAARLSAAAADQRPRL